MLTTHPGRPWNCSAPCTPQIPTENVFFKVEWPGIMVISSGGRGSRGATGRRSGFRNEFRVVLSPAANPADSNAWRAANSSPIMANLSALAPSSAVCRLRLRMRAVADAFDAAIESSMSNSHLPSEERLKTILQFLPRNLPSTTRTEEKHTWQKKEELPTPLLLRHIMMRPPTSSSAIRNAALNPPFKKDGTVFMTCALLWNISS